MQTEVSVQYFRSIAITLASDSGRECIVCIMRFDNYVKSVAT
jgi:hypothetical protein